MANAINQIDRQAVHRICSGQVVLDLATAVKELIENSIDAGATSIDVKFKEQGLAGLEVIDNGSGIEPSNYEALALKHYTSKLKNFEDLEQVGTFGFRGEALSSLCALSELAVVTSTRDQGSKGVRLTYDADGKLTSQTPAPRSHGTTIQLSELFKALPVRQREFKRNIKREYAKALSMIQAYGIISTHVRIMVTNQTGKGQSSRVLATNGNKSVRENISNVFGTKTASQLIPFTVDLPSLKEDKENSGQPSIVGWISKPQPGYGRSSGDRQYFYINGRPCTLPKVAKAFNEVYRDFLSNQYPFLVADLQIAPDSYDVNVTPDKRTIFLHNEQAVTSEIVTSLTDRLEPSRSTFETRVSTTPTESSPSTDTPRSEELRNDTHEDDGPESANFNHAHGLSSTGSLLTTPENPSRQIMSSAVSTYGVSQNLNPSTGSFSISSMSRLAAHSSYKPARTSTTRSKRPTTTLLDYISKRPKPSTSAFAQAGAQKASPDGSDEEDANIEEQHHDDTIFDDEEEADKEEGSQEERGEEPMQVEEGMQIEPADEQGYDGEQEETMQLDQNLTNGRRHGPGSDEYADEDSQELPEPETRTAAQAAFVTTSPVGKRNAWYTGEARPVLARVSMTSLARTPRVPSPEQCPVPDDVLRALENASIANVHDPSRAETALSRVIRKQDFGQMRVLGQFNLGFIVAALDGHDLFVIDQHASDEKYNFETLQATTIIQGQRLFNPQNLELTAAEELVVLDHMDILRANGFDLQVDMEKEPTQRVQVISQPFSKNVVFDKKDFGELVFQLMEHPGQMARCSRARAMFASRACRRSVMVGHSLNKRQMKKILEHMGEIEQPWNCPHGRPTMRHLCNLNDIRDQQIKRERNRPLTCKGSLFPLSTS
ncbi:hypothetical protein BCR43DRAFT_452802 [Syncephalastrum racemosum]|uniref:DNA mismatch repair protein PMS1 n=1 Tax=Syncephalastrum racemosum TaxID=13706 RepID=A0A1X2HN18_SYNRA|nr:hypothetical protein BCR43DRAFT_452802 [Syncephalastrum racemosum]